MTIAVAAFSGRALAAAAQRAGERCHVIDLFADSDTLALAARCIRVAGAAGEGLDRTALRRALASLRPDLTGIVYGAGFERDATVLALLGEYAPVIGNPPDVVAAVKDPMCFAATLNRLGLPYPETRLDRPSGRGWLAKRAGGCGGTHIERAHSVGGTAARGRYFQRRAGGRPVSALFVADGGACRILGFSAQWSDPVPGMPFRYGGCATPIAPAPPVAVRLDAACAALVAATGLRGLNSLDVLVDGADFRILEVNPRPGATLDIFDGRDGLALWRLHCEGVAGRLPPPMPMPPPMPPAIPGPSPAGRAAAIVYAPRRVSVPPGFLWPSWIADRPIAGSVIERGEPVCTVSAEAASARGARLAVHRRAARILAALPSPASDAVPPIAALLPDAVPPASIPPADSAASG